MKPIPKTFKQNRFNFELVTRNGQVAMFKKDKPGIDQTWYEVVVLRQEPDKTMFGRFVPAHEVMPRNEEWGANGWTYTDLTAAMVRFSNLVLIEMLQNAPICKDMGT